MPDVPDSASVSDWEVSATIEWLLHEGRLLADINELVFQLGHRMYQAGAPICRLRLSMLTLHPLVAAISAIWEKDHNIIPMIETPHGLEQRSDYRGSPLQIIGETRQSFRKRLTGTLSSADDTLLHELKARGCTDYFGHWLSFSAGTGAILIYTSETEGGFTDRDIDCIQQIADVVAPIAEVFSVRIKALAVTEAYLGSRTGQRVLDGQITRGHVENIHAAILFSDIRDWTGLNTRLLSKQLLVLANRYFDIIAEAVDAHEGEILKFMGDGVLVIFPIENKAEESTAVCDRALAAARQAQQLARDSGLSDEITFGIGMHFGEVLYGNIGSTMRLDFTVLGQAVNIASRIEGLCGKLDKSVLFSQRFADQLSEPATLIAKERLKGLEEKFNVLSIPEDSLQANSE